MLADLFPCDSQKKLNSLTKAQLVKVALQNKSQGVCLCAASRACLCSASRNRRRSFRGEGVPQPGLCKVNRNRAVETFNFVCGRSAGGAGIEVRLCMVFFVKF